MNKKISVSFFYLLSLLVSVFAYADTPERYVAPTNSQPYIEEYKKSFAKSMSHHDAARVVEYEKAADIARRQNAIYELIIDINNKYPSINGLGSSFWGFADKIGNAIDNLIGSNFVQDKDWYRAYNMLQNFEFPDRDLVYAQMKVKFNNRTIQHARFMRDWCQTNHSLCNADTVWDKWNSQYPLYIGNGSLKDEYVAATTAINPQVSYEEIVASYPGDAWMRQRKQEAAMGPQVQRVRCAY